jgi:hypothetical protein
MKGAGRPSSTKSRRRPTSCGMPSVSIARIPAKAKKKPPEEPATEGVPAPTGAGGEPGRGLGAEDEGELDGGRPACRAGDWTGSPGDGAAVPNGVASCGVRAPVTTTLGRDDGRGARSPGACIPGASGGDVAGPVAGVAGTGAGCGDRVPPTGVADTTVGRGARRSVRGAESVAGGAASGSATR